MTAKGTRVWTCDHCGKRETWRKGWSYFGHEIPSAVNHVKKSNAETAEGDIILPAAFCSEKCAHKWLDDQDAARVAP